MREAPKGPPPWQSLSSPCARPWPEALSESPGVLRPDKKG